MNRHRHRAASATIALVATVLIVAPVWAAKPAGAGDGSNGTNGGNGGNQGSVSVVDAVSGLESLTNSEPHVCSFFLAFDGAPSGESGDWSIVGWPPTGTGAEVMDGQYAIPAGGSYVTGTFALDAGHYRVHWQAINTESEKHKTFWVDEGCSAEEAEDQPEDEEQPADEPADEPTDEPEDEEQPVDEPAAEPTDEPVDEAEELPEEGDVESAVEDPPAPDETAAEPAPEEQPADAPDVEGDLAPSNAGNPVVSELPDTAMPAPATSGLAVTLGILLLVVAHCMPLRTAMRARLNPTRRHRQMPTFPIGWLGAAHRVAPDRAGVAKWQTRRT